MEISNDRLKHSIAVARKMRELAIAEPKRYPVNPEDAFILGLIHDIGYEFSDDQRGHAFKGGEILKRQNYKYWQEVYYHGIPQTEYNTPMLQLLNYVDLITSNTGEYVSIEERIRGITERYGKDSWQEKEAIQLTSIIHQYSN